MKFHKILSLILLLCAIPLMSSAQTFDEYFTDATLRLDYIFSGDAKNQEISVDELHILP